MAVLRDRPYGNYNYLVDLGTGNTDGPEAGFAEVILPETWLDTIEYRNGNEKESSTHKIPGRAHYGDVTLRRGVIGATDLYSWINDIRNGNQLAYRTVTIQLLNEDRTAVVLAWRLQRAWPVRYKFSNLQADGKDVLFEIIELAYERMEME